MNYEYCLPSAILSLTKSPRIKISMESQSNVFVRCFIDEWLLKKIIFLKILPAVIELSRNEK